MSVSSLTANNRKHESVSDRTQQQIGYWHILWSLLLKKIQLGGYDEAIS